MKARRPLWKHTKMLSSPPAGRQRNLRTRTRIIRVSRFQKLNSQTRQVCYAKIRELWLAKNNKTLTHVKETSGLVLPKIFYLQIALNPQSLQKWPITVTKSKHSPRLSEDNSETSPLQDNRCPLRICHHLPSWPKRYEGIWGVMKLPISWSWLGLHECVYLSKLRVKQYKFKWECYNIRAFNVITLVTTKKLAVEYTKRKWERNLSISPQKKKVM